MWVYYDKQQTLVEQTDASDTPARVGSVGEFRIFAYIEGIDPDDYPDATIRLQKPTLDPIVTPDLFVTDRKSIVFKGSDKLNYFKTGESYKGFEFVFNTSGLLDTSGLWKATFYLNGTSHNPATGLIKFNVQESVYDEEPVPMSWFQWQQILTEHILSKMPLKGSKAIRYVNNETVYEMDKYQSGDIVFNTDDNKLYILSEEESPDDPEQTVIVKTEFVEFAEKNYLDSNFERMLKIVSNVYEPADTNNYRIFRVDNLSKIGEFSNWQQGQMFFVKDLGSSHHKALIEIDSNSSSGYNVIFDFTTSENRMIASSNVTRTVGTSETTYLVKFKNGINDIITQFSIILENATQSSSGLMSSSDKSTLDGVSTTFESRFNKKQDLTSNSETYYPSVKAVKAAVDEIISRIRALEGLGRYLSVWNATTGKPGELPGEVDVLTEEYVFKTGDWYKVGTGGYKIPTGVKLSVGTTIANFPSATGTTELKPNDTILFNGTGWEILHTPEIIVAFENIAGDPYDNANLKTAFDAKQNKVYYGNTEPTGNIEEGDLWAYEGVDLRDVAIGDGLEIVTDSQTGVRTLRAKPKLYRYDVDLYFNTDPETPPDINMSGYIVSTAKVTPTYGSLTSDQLKQIMNNATYVYLEHTTMVTYDNTQIRVGNKTGKYAEMDTFLCADVIEI